MKKALLFLLLLTATPFLSVAQTYTPKANLSAARYGFSSVTVNGKMYIFGGSNLNNVLTTVEEYDPVTDTWASKQPVPYTITEAFIGVVNGKIYVVGGWDGNWAVNYVQEFDPATNTWAQKATMPTTRASLSGTVIGGKIYVTCGWHGEYKTLEVYDPATNTWVAKTDAPYGMLQNNSGTALGNNMYIIGGRNYQKTMYYNHNMQYNTVTDTWVVKAALPAPRFAGCAVTYQGKIHYFGGKSSDLPSTVSNTHYIYDEATDTWTTGMPLPKRLSHISATVIDNKIYISGGMDSSGVLVSNLWEYGIMGDTTTGSDTTTGGDSTNHIAAAAMQTARLAAYPNPANNTVHVKLSNIGQNAQLLLCNTVGIVLKTIAVKEEDLIIDISAMPAGIYTLKYSDEMQGGYLKLTKL